MDEKQPSNALLPPGEELSPTEQEVIDEYVRLADNMKKLASILDTMAAQPTTEILDGLRELERKTALVFTLLKTSVYSIVLQQELDWDHTSDNLVEVLGTAPFACARPPSRLYTVQLSGITAALKNVTSGKLYAHRYTVDEVLGIPPFY